MRAPPRSAPRDRLSRAIDRGRLELAHAVRAPEDLGSTRTIDLSRRLDALIVLYLRLTAPPAPHR